jgi:hypothetical protein
MGTNDQPFELSFPSGEYAFLPVSAPSYEDLPQICQKFVAEFLPFQGAFHLALK